MNSIRACIFRLLDQMFSQIEKYVHCIRPSNMDIFGELIGFPSLWIWYFRKLQHGIQLYITCFYNYIGQSISESCVVLIKLVVFAFLSDCFPLH
jgi:hypothetical protein